VDLGAMTVSLRADLSGLDAGLRRAQELISGATEELTRQEQRFRVAGMAARDYGAGVSRWMAGITGAIGAVGKSAAGLEGRWGHAWEAMDAASDAALARITRRFGHSVAAMIVDGHGLREFWRGLWRDLLEIAVQRLLQMVLQTRSAAGAMRDALSAVSGGLFGSTGGLVGELFGGVFGGILSGVGDIFGKIGDWLGFDNPKHDAWARKQGFDFGKHFRAGVMKAMALPLGPVAVSGPGVALAGIGGAGAAQFRAVSIARGAFQVIVNAQKLDERVVRDAGGIIADEVSRRLGWTDRRSGV